MNGSSLLCLGESARRGTAVGTLHPSNPFKYTLGWDGKCNSILLWNKCNFLFIIMFIWQAEQLETRKTINRNDSSDIFSEKKNVLTSREKKKLMWVPYWLWLIWLCSLKQPADQQATWRVGKVFCSENKWWFQVTSHKAKIITLTLAM